MFRGGNMPAVVHGSIALPVEGGYEIGADLVVPDQAVGLIVFAHGSGSSRFSSRNRTVAEALQRRRLGTLLADLLTREEESVDVHTSEHRFDIPLLGRRVVSMLDWIDRQPQLRSLPAGCFGASTGAAAALIGAAQRPAQVRAVVSRGGRPDLAEGALARVTAPTLLIVGERDEAVIELNREAMAQMRSAQVELAIVPGATHLFEEPGTLQQVQALAGAWFVSQLQQ
jgi:putative phosphoribosyl transferase